MIVARFYAHTFSAGFLRRRAGSGRKGKRRKRCKENFYLLPSVCLAFLKGEAQPQANGPAIVNALVLVALVELSEVRVEINLCNRQELPGNGVNL